MPIIRTSKVLITLLFISFLYIGWQPAYAESADQQAAQHEGGQLNLSGLYLGFFPCADCQGVRTTLALNKNGTYVYMYINVGKSDREFTEKGKYTVSENNKLTLTPKKDSDKKQQYLIENDKLIKLDEDGKKMSEGDEGYILKRKDVVNTPATQHSGH